MLMGVLFFDYSTAIRGIDSILILIFPLSILYGGLSIKRAAREDVQAGRNNRW